MAIRHIKQELEAKLTSKTPGFFSKPSGKIERKSYQDGVERLKIKIAKLKLPDHTRLNVTADGNQIAEMEIENGYAKIDQESNNPAEIPELKVNQLIEIKLNNETLLSGKLYID